MKKHLSLVKASYHDFEATFSEDGWFNATVAAVRYGKVPHEWLRLPATQEYLAALERKYGKIPYLKTRRGKTGGGTWLHPKLAVQFARWLDVDFSIWCDEQIDSLIRGEHEFYDWKRARHEATSSFKVMNTILQMQRQVQGKEIKPHHYSNEARLVNWALMGEFKPLDRRSLTIAELDVLAKLEEQNAVLLGCGLDYPTRKKALENYAVQCRIFLLEKAA